MITIKQIRGAKNYFENYLYYSNGQKAVGFWRGKLAEILGIEGKEVTGGDFEALGNNRHPFTNEKLRPRSAKVQFHDVVISAPKSFSVAALVGKDERLVEGFQRAVEKTFRRLEKTIAVRDRAGAAYNTENYVTTGNGAAAVFLHDDNRLSDPQLHMHLVFSNHSFSTERDGYFALQPKIMMDEAKEWITDRFHRDLAKEAIKAGYKVSLPGNRLRLSGIGLKLELKFSKRAQQRRKFERRYRKQFGKEPDQRRITQFISDRKTTARKRFRDEYQAHFGKRPAREEVDEFVVDWRTTKNSELGEEDKYLYQRKQLTSYDAKRLDGEVRQARTRMENRHKRLRQEGEAETQRREPEVSEWGKAKPDKRHRERRQRKVDGVTRKQSGRKTQVRRNSIGRMEAIRRMRRGMSIAGAMQGHPSMFLARQLSILAQRLKHHEGRKESQTML